jgi:hypothetical protein
MVSSSVVHQQLLIDSLVISGSPWLALLRESPSEQLP